MKSESGGEHSIPSSFIAAAIALLAMSLLLANCGGGDWTSENANPTVGGQVSGLVGTVVLQNNGTDTFSATVDGNFTFPAPLPYGSDYDITVATQPLGQTCTVANGKGTATANITTVVVICSTNSYSVGGTVTGLPADGFVTLQNNGVDRLTVSVNGAFAFGKKLLHGDNYDVEVSAQPGGLTCSVSTGTGIVSGNDVANVVVVCATNTYSVGGTITGLAAGASVVLQNNNGDNLNIGTNGVFAFATPVANGSPYSVTVLTQPAGQSCSVANGTGTITRANVADVAVVCSNQTYTVGGTMSGLAGTMILQNNNGDNLSIGANGPFTFATPIANGSPYSVTVLTQPAGQTCSVAGGAGIIAAASVTGVTVVCSNNAYIVAGTVSGLGGSLVLQNNDADSLVIAANGIFTFATPVANGSPYSVTVLTQPTGQTCSVTNGTGTIAAANVTGVTVVCSNNAYSVSGTISGLTSSVVLQNNNGDNLTVASNGAFAFPIQVAHGSPYTVTVLAQPAGQTCTVANGTGTITAANVTNITVACTTNTYRVGGSVSGLVGSVVLQNNGGDSLTVNANGNFTFATALVNGSPYSVSVLTQPAEQNCTVTGGTGTIAAANVTTVSVVCSTSTYSVGGTISGLVGSVALQINGGSNLTVGANGAFTFAPALPSGSAYSVTVLTHPTGQNCSVTNGSGTIAGANVTNISVACSTNTYSVGGTVSGLAGSLILQNNGGDNLTIGANGTFTFATALVSGNPYNVTVLTQPAGQTCTVVSGTGTIATGNVTNVSVVCSNNTYTVGGTISGLGGSVVLQNNNGDNLTIGANGAFTFATPLLSGSPYSVTVLTQPTGQTCSVRDGTGTIGTANVNTVAVTCV